MSVRLIALMSLPDRLRRSPELAPETDVRTVSPAVSFIDCTDPLDSTTLLTWIPNSEPLPLALVLTT
jgi:hypothetical protein